MSDINRQAVVELNGTSHSAELHPDIKTVDQAAALLGISKHSLYAKIRAGELPAMRFGKKSNTIRLHWPTVIHALQHKEEPA